MSFFFLKVRHSPIIAPVAIAAPSQRLILGPANLARLGILIALKLGRRAAEQALVEGALAVAGVGVGGGDVCCVAGGFRRGRGLGRLDLLEGGGDGGGALEALEFGLLGGGELWRRGAGGEC